VFVSFYHSPCIFSIKICPPPQKSSPSFPISLPIAKGDQPSSVVRPTLLYISSQAVIPAKAGIQSGNTGFPRIKYGAGLVKPGMTIKVKGLLTQYTGVR
jgi:hypothetical protein